MAFKSVLILGGLGQTGGLFARSFAEAGTEVTYVDRRDWPPQHVPPGSYLQVDVTRPDAVLLKRIATAECVLVCLPEEAALCAASHILGAMADGALWVDTLSVKSGICRLLGDCKRSIEIVSINPMFAPALGWQGHPVAVIELSSGPKSQAFINLLKSWRAAVEMLTAETHDSLTAIIQVATHAAVLSFGALLLDLEYSVERGLAIATPPHRLLLALVSRIISANPGVYWEIQHYHPDGEIVRRRLARAVECIDAAAAADSPAQFQQFFGEIRSLFSAKRESLEGLSERIVSEAGKMQ
jgi:prephenate dehydrogenase